MRGPPPGRSFRGVSATDRRTYLVECYAPGIDRARVGSEAARAAAAAAELRADGVSVEYLQALLVCADEVVFHVFASDGAAAVREASLRAGVAFERVLESVALDAHSHLEESPGPHG
jgi:hypothetical protein